MEKLNEFLEILTKMGFTKEPESNDEVFTMNKYIDVHHIEVLVWKLPNENCSRASTILSTFLDNTFSKRINRVYLGSEKYEI